MSGDKESQGSSCGKSQKTEALDDKAFKKKKKKKKSDDDQQQRRVFAFLVYADSSYPDWVDRLRAAHVRGFISPYHDRDLNVDGSPKKPHWHVILFFEGKHTTVNIDKLREEVLGPDYYKKYEKIGTPGAYVRYLTHMDDPDKAQYERNDVVSLGGADFELAASMPGDDTVVMASVSAYVVSADITSVNQLIAVCKAEGRRDWLSYISRRGYVVGMMIGHNAKRLARIRQGVTLPGDVPGDVVVEE